MKTQQEILDIALHGLMSEKAHDALGVYPAANACGPNPYEKRNDFQEGWNAAIMAYYHKRVVFGDFIETLTDEQKTALNTLIFSDDFELYEHNDEVSLCLNMNDTFYYAADSEDVCPEDLPLVAQLYDKYDYHGLTAWAAKKRNMEPLERKRKYWDTPKYREAIAFLEIYDGDSKEG